MVAKNNDKIAAPATPTGEWGGETLETLGGMEAVEKPNLIGVPFVITGYKFTHNPTRNIGYAWVEFETTPNGERKYFYDSSATGVRFDIETIHFAKHPELAGELKLEEWYDLRLLVPRGLRESEFDTKDERGAKIRGRAFYLTKVATGRQ